MCIIEQQNETVFVPIPLPVEVDSMTEGVKERLFSDRELQFLEDFGVVPCEGLLDGKEVWEVYERLVYRDHPAKFDLEEKLGYFYLSHWEDEGVNGKLYDYKMGLNNRALKDITFI